MSNTNHNPEIINDNIQAHRPEKAAYQRPQLIRYGELASLTQSGPTTSAVELASTWGPISGT